MRAHHRAGAFAVKVQIPNVIFAPRDVQLLPVGRVDGACQAVFGVVGHLQPLLEVSNLDERQHRPKDLLLGHAGIGRNLRKDCGLKEIAAFDLWRLAAGNQPAFFFAGFNIAQHGIQCGFVDHRAEVVVLSRVAHRQLGHARKQLFYERVVDRGFDDGAGAGRALLPAEAEGRGCHALDGRVQIGVGADQDGVLAAHLQNRPLQPDLIGFSLGGALVNLQSHFFGTGEGDEAGLGMLDDGVAEAGAGAGAEVDHAGREARLFQYLDRIWRQS